MREDEIDLWAEKMDQQAVDELNEMLSDGRNKILAHNIYTKDQIAENRFGQDKIDIREAVFRNVSLGSLNNWLEKISTNADVSKFKTKISEIKAKKEALDEEIEEYNRKIDEIKSNPIMNKDAERVSRIILQAVDQNPNLTAQTAKAFLISDEDNVTVDINKIDELTEAEKDELYEQYLYEFKILAGLI